MGGLAIVLGSATDALAEYEAAKALVPAAFVVCVNDALRTCPDRVHAFATLHPEKRERFLGVEDCELKRHPDCSLWTYEAPINRRGGFNIAREKWAGSSGLFAVQIALEKLDAAGVILAGVPMDAARRATYADAEAEWGGGETYVQRYQRGWTKAHSILRARVRSFSGFTRDLLGPPTPEWIAEKGLSAAA